MSIHHLERAARLPMQATRKLVFMALCDDADKASGVAMPGIETVMQWAGCGRSQAQEHLSALIADGYVERLTAGRIGRRAEFRVFARVACCSEHGPMTPDEAPTTASGHPDALPTGASGERPESVRRASGPDRTPPYPPIPLSKGEGPEVISPARAEGEPSPFNDIGGNTPPDTTAPLRHPDRCARHQLDDFPPPCGACKVARETHEASLRARVHQDAERERQARREAARLAQLDIGTCGMCDDDGRDATGLPCSHDPDVAERARRGAAEARAAIKGGAR